MKLKQTRRGLAALRTVTAFVIGIAVLAGLLASGTEWAVAVSCGWGAMALAIARNVAIDAYRRERITSSDVPDLESVDEPLPYEELRRLTADLPQKERAAVFLRYGYDLSYEDIGNALGSSSEAARQAASSGVRRLRRKELS